MTPTDPRPVSPEAAPPRCAICNHPMQTGGRTASGYCDNRTCPRQGLIMSIPEAAPPVTMWVAECPFRKNGSPVLGTMGARVGTVILFTHEEWRRLCLAVPQIATTQFRVGTYD